MICSPTLSSASGPVLLLVITSSAQERLALSALEAVRQQSLLQEQTADRELRFPRGFSLLPTFRDAELARRREARVLVIRIDFLTYLRD